MSFLLNHLKAQRAISRTFCHRMFSTSRGAPFAHVLRTMNQASALDNTTPASSRRSLSTYGGSNASYQGIRAYPQYTVYGDNCLAMKIMPPGFRLSKNNILGLDNARKGRILLEFTPRGADGKYSWEDALRFGLNAEEVGLLINQLPHYKVEFSRVPSAYEDQSSYGSAVSSDMPEKVLTVEPGELGAVNFTLDYVRDGVGGQAPGQGQDGKAGPIIVQVQAGEFEVMAELMRHSIPHLTGWAEKMNIVMQHQVSEPINGGGGSHSGGRGGGAGNDLPF